MQVASGVQWTVASDGVVVIQILPGEELRLNAVGSLIWTLVARGAGEAEIAGEIVREFDVDPATAAGELDEFLAELEDQLLLERE